MYLSDGCHGHPFQRGSDGNMAKRSPFPMRTRLSRGADITLFTPATDILNVAHPIEPGANSVKQFITTQMGTRWPCMKRLQKPGPNFPGRDHLQTGFASPGLRAMPTLKNSIVQNQ